MGTPARTQQDVGRLIEQRGFRGCIRYHAQYFLPKALRTIQKTRKRGKPLWIYSSSWPTNLCTSKNTPQILWKLHILFLLVTGVFTESLELNEKHYTTTAYRQLLIVHKTHGTSVNKYLCKEVLVVKNNAARWAMANYCTFISINTVT